jgi:hypothetical protein
VLASSRVTACKRVRYKSHLFLHGQQLMGRLWWNFGTQQIVGGTFVCVRQLLTSSWLCLQEVMCEEIFNFL